MLRTRCHFPNCFTHRESKFIEASYVCTTRCHPSLEKKRVRKLDKIKYKCFMSPSCSLLYQGASSRRKKKLVFCSVTFAVRKETSFLLKISKTLLNCYRNAAFASNLIMNYNFACKLYYFEYLLLA